MVYLNGPSQARRGGACTILPLDIVRPDADFR
jgi:hypothetical protein